MGLDDHPEGGRVHELKRGHLNEQEVRPPGRFLGEHIAQLAGSDVGLAGHGDYGAGTVSGRLRRNGNGQLGHETVTWPWSRAPGSGGR